MGSWAWLLLHLAVAVKADTCNVSGCVGGDSHGLILGLLFIIGPNRGSPI